MTALRILGRILATQRSRSRRDSCAQVCLSTARAVRSNVIARYVTRYSTRYLTPCCSMVRFGTVNSCNADEVENFTNATWAGLVAVLFLDHETPRRRPVGLVGKGENSKYGRWLISTKCLSVRSYG